MKLILLLLLAPFLLILLIPLGALAIVAGTVLFGVIAGITAAIFGIFVAIFAVVFGAFVSIGAIGIIFIKALLIIFVVIWLISVISNNSARSGAFR